MNDLAREALVKHALLGTKQIQGHMGIDDGRCAIGVLAEECGALNHIGVVVFDNKPLNWYDANLDMVSRLYGMTMEEIGEVMSANDQQEWDFLTIARKCCNGPESTQEEPAS